MEGVSKDIFRAYDIRGRYPQEFNEEIASRIASLIQDKVLKKGKVVVGHDVRFSSPVIYRSVIKSLRDRGIKIIKAGLISTPMLYFLVNKLRASTGIMITASHNPKEYNGLKVVGEKATPISGKEIYKLWSH